jgi:hypothetical protein
VPVFVIFDVLPEFVAPILVVPPIFVLPPPVILVFVVVTLRFDVVFALLVPVSEEQVAPIKPNAKIADKVNVFFIG